MSRTVNTENTAVGSQAIFRWRREIGDGLMGLTPSVLTNDKTRKKITDYREEKN